MSYKDITAGNKLAKAIAGRFIQSEKGTLGIEVAFKFQENGVEEKINWVGWLTAAAMPNTMRTLVDALGFNGDDEVLPNGLLKPEALDTSRNVELVVELETYEGKTSPRVKWVNQPGSGSAFKSLEPVKVRSQLASIGFKAAYLASKQGVVAPQAPVAQTPIPEEALPF